MKTHALVIAALLATAACSGAPAAPTEPVATETSEPSEIAAEQPALEAPAADVPVAKDEAAQDMPMVGGPCAYDTKEITAMVKSVNGTEVELEEADGHVFWHDLASPDETLAPGARLRFTKRFIVEGTCTPFSYVLIGPATDEAAAAD